MLAKIKSIPFKQHIIINIILRLILIIYGEVQDNISIVPYTDVDYKVVTDGAYHVWNGGSPYKRHTYRYTPILSYLLLPNLFLHKSFGKILFSLFDICVGILINKIVENEIKENKKQTLHKTTSVTCTKIADLCSLSWLYNPLTMVIATRGNGDSISSFFVLLSLYFLLKPENKIIQYLYSGIVHGIAIHFRLYPIVFSLSFYLTISSYQRHKNIIKAIIFPNQKQLMLVCSTVISLLGLTYIFYYLYGYNFLYETYIYHLVRKDTRHNFSLYFYMQYLSSELPIFMLEKIVTFLPQLLVLFVLTMKFGLHRKTLPFCIFSQAFTIVTYNPVVTSQYFVWFLSLLPLCIKNFKTIGYKSGVAYTLIWFLGQGGWLLPAYFLEFKGWNTFEFLWLQGIMFFSVNIYILQRLIMNFSVVPDKAKTL